MGISASKILIINRALIEMVTRPSLADNLAYRGGTALYKRHLQPARYSEDIDPVRTRAGAIGPLMTAVGAWNFQEAAGFVMHELVWWPVCRVSHGKVCVTCRQVVAIDV